MGHFADLCPPRSRCSAICGTLFAVHYDVYTISAGGHVSRFAIGSRSIGISSSKVSTFFTFADLCPPRSRCSAMSGTLFELHYDVYTISAGGHASRFVIGSRSIGISSSKVSTFLTFADLCPPRNQCSATCGTLIALHYALYTIRAGAHVSRFTIGSRSIEVSSSKVSTLLTFTTPRHILVSSPCSCFFPCICVFLVS